MPGNFPSLDLLRQGLPCRVFEGAVASPYGYHLLLLLQRKRRLRPVRRFVDWVHGELKAQTA